MLDRKTPPPFQHTTSFTLLEPEKITLPNGLTIVFVNGGEQEVTKIEFVFKAGKWFETKPGIAYFTTHLLQKGTTTKNSYEISELIDQHGLSVEVNPGFDFSSISLYGLSKNIYQSFDLVKEILSQPTFPENELQQAKDIYVQGLRINLEKTSYLASKQLRQNLFGASHPYGKDASVEEVNALTRDSLSAFHQQRFTDFEVICSGKITRTIKDAVINLVSSFTKYGMDKPEGHTIITGEKKQYIEKQDSVQSSIRMGKRSIGRTHDDYAALLLLNHIFGGYFGSRLMKNIREEKGLTYGIYSSLSPLKNDCFITIGADVNKENRELTVEEIKKELQALREKVIDSNELETARNHFIGSMQSELSTPFAHADKIKSSILHNLPQGFYQSLILKIDALMQDDLQRTAKKYFDEESFIEVAVG
jgi:predicted Zn-dependent peptidase